MQGVGTIGEIRHLLLLGYDNREIVFFRSSMKRRTYCLVYPTISFSVFTTHHTLARSVYFTALSMQDNNRIWSSEPQCEYARKSQVVKDLNSPGDLVYSTSGLDSSTSKGQTFWAIPVSAGELAGTRGSSQSPSGPIKLTLVGTFKLKMLNALKILITKCELFAGMFYTN